jgi:hypothetical protein
MPRITPSMMDRIVTFRAAWREMAPTATFAGMTLAEFEVATEPPLALRADIAALELQLDAKKAARSDADGAASELLDLFVNSVRGTPGFGPDCPLYRALGYIRKSERKSGLTRKGVTPAVNANVA